MKKPEYNSVMVHWYDPRGEQPFNARSTLVSDEPEEAARVYKDVDAHGCTSPEQAERLGRYHLAQARLGAGCAAETEEERGMVAFVKKLIRRKREPKPQSKCEPKPQIYVDRVGHDLLITYKGIPYRGSCTVYHYADTGERCSSGLERALNPVWKKFVWWEENCKTAGDWPRPYPGHKDKEKDDA